MPSKYYTTEVACPLCNAKTFAKSRDCMTYEVVCMNPKCDHHWVSISAMFIECDACNSPCVAYQMKKPESKFDNPRYQYMCRVKNCEKRGRTQVIEINQHGHLIKPERV